MIIPGHEPGKEPVRFLQCFVEPILSVAGPVLVGRFDLLAEVFPGTIVDSAIFIDVVAKVNDEIEVLLLHVRIAVEITAFEMLAGGKGKTNEFGVGVVGGSGSSPADRTGFVSGMKTVVIPAMRSETVHLNVNRVTQLRHRECIARLGKILELLIGGDLPADPDRFRIHAASVEWLRGEAGPENDAIRLRIS